jgi:hypothetical protein
MLLVYQEEGVYSNLCNATNATVTNGTKTVGKLPFILSTE